MQYVHIVIATFKSNYSKLNQQGENNNKKSNHKVKFRIFIKLQINKFKKLFYKIDDVVGYKIVILIFVACLFFIRLYTNNAQVSHIPISVIPNHIEDPSIQIKDVPTIPVKYPKNYFSLPNGTVLFKNPYYLNGLGELKIDNGTDMDAMAKLVYSPINKSICAVYIKAKSVYTIPEISDGEYMLYFTHGQNWDNINKKFLKNKAYSKFEDNFEFITKEQTKYNGVETIYSTFEITLHPVISGTANTDEINAEEFEKL